MKKKIGHKIRQIRKRQNGGKGLSMEEFGKLFDPPASKGVVSNWENNYNYPNEKRLQRIAELGGISTRDLLYGPYTGIMEKVESESNEEYIEYDEVYYKEKERLYKEHLESYYKELSDSVEASREFLIDYIESPTNTSSFNHSILLLNQALRFSYIHKTENDDDPVLIRFLEDVIRILNEYSTNDKSLDQYSEEEIRNNVLGKVKYILDRARKE